MKSKCYCPRCKKYTLDPSDCGESGLYMSNHLICNDCFIDEDDEIYDKGTNELPDTLESYGPVNYHIHDFY